MRYFLLFLVLLNATIFGWFSFQSHQRETAEGKRYKVDVLAYPQVKLKSEMDASGLRKRPAPSAEKPEKTVIEAAMGGNAESARQIREADTCLLLGPYEEIVTARGHLFDLAREQQHAEMIERTTALEPLFHVYIGPLADMGEAVDKLSELQALGIDSYVVTEGEYTHAISLGIFSVEDSADAVVDELTSQGFKARKVLRQKELSSLWLLVPSKSLANFSTELFEKMKKENILLKKEEKGCGSVALLKRIH